ncbi:hypothetical protein Bca52824_029983 [Brassica carinata]|uniref:non-specific serine/threonine protein kinase n=1 Tax=Brassica carinata TaxID=52824 RepID=A0A8X7S8A8_BRACI|nr:hypothetical protein Bca52824_029983 [Brassica carinata]
MASESRTRWVLPYKTKNLKDDYVLGRVLGQGQYGTTFLCTHNETGQKLACKSIPKRKLLRQEHFDRVLREIQIMHHLSEYPNVVRIQSTYEDATSVHLVMELCEGGELFDRIVTKGLLDPLLRHIDGYVTPGGAERFRRCHNTEGTMQFWLESADLMKIKRESGVPDPNWVPPPWWKSN